MLGFICNSRCPASLSMWFHDVEWRFKVVSMLFVWRLCDCLLFDGEALIGVHLKASCSGY